MRRVEPEDFSTMARTAARGFWSQLRARARTVRRCLAAVAVFALLAVPTVSSAQQTRPDPVKGEASFSTSGGYARLTIKLAEDVASQVTSAGSILVIRFERPVDLSADRLAESALDYVSSARRDPDGTAIRFSLARRVTINTMSAGERTFVDLLPDGWTGPPPPLPIEVVRELAERARAAERALRQQRAEALARKRPPVRVRALMQPTFVRFVFEMPDGVGASSIFNDQKLTLSFNGLLTFDLADALVAAPPNIASIKQRVEGDNTLIEIDMIGDVDVHSFREDKNYNIDVAFQQPDKAKVQALPTADASHAPPPAAATPKKEAAGEKRAEEIAPPTSEAIARQMKAEGKAERPSPAPEATEAPKVEAIAARPPAAEAPKEIVRESVKPEAAREQPAHTAEAAKPAESAAAESPKEMPAPAAEDAKPELPAPAVEAPKPAEAPPKMASIAPATDQTRPATKPEAKPEAKVQTKSEAKPAGDPVKVEAWRDSDGLRLTFSFSSVTPAASFRRGDTVWLIFDSKAPLDVEPIRARAGAVIGEVNRLPLDHGQAIRFRLNRPQMHSLSTDERASGTSWTMIFADKVQAPPQPLSVARNITEPALANVAVTLSNPGVLHRLVDPDAGDTLLVVTAPPPVRGFIKRQDFVDFSLLDSAHGVAIRPNSDDVAVEPAGSKIIIGKPGGLTLSPVDVSAERAPIAVRPLFDVEEWRKNQTGNFLEREYALIQAMARAEPDLRPQARLDLARFYMARAMYPEAKGVTEAALTDPNAKKDESGTLMVHAVASILIGRPGRGLKELANPAIGSNYDSQMWQALALGRQSKWAEAREKFKNVEFAIASLPIDLQRIVTMDAMRAALEVKDYAGAAKRRAELEVIGVPAEQQPAAAVLRGRLAEALGHDLDALDEYKSAIDSDDRQSAAEAKLLQIVLKQKRDEIKQADVLRELETLSMIWRGDSIEVKTLQKLAQIYNETARYSESLQAARTATRLEPNSESSRAAQDQAQALFTQIFLSEKGDNLPPIDALGMFYEFRELTPIGRRGDELIRRLADRLVAVDLLDQAAELLQYQVDKRLEGSARAQVAAKLAMVYLANRKPDLAITALRATRIADLSGELRAQRLLLEARAQSDIGRHDLAIDIVSNITGREAIRLRSDIYWAARRWREASEQIELYYGDRWRDFKPLNPAEKSDVIRAVVGYALAEDAIGMARFREKYAPLMSGEADKIAFDTASKPRVANSGDFAAIAKMAASVDTLEGFLREMKTRFPDATGRTPMADPDPTGSLPPIPASVRRVGG
jgi:chemotaxis protein histidine kinase CheA